MAYTTPKALFKAICDAIREKDGTIDLINHQDIPSRITEIEAKLQSKSANPSEISQTIEPDSGYDGLSSVSIRAISGNYIGSKITKKEEETYTPSTSDQTIQSGQYLEGNQTIKGDANFIESNIKKDVTMFGKTGTYEGETSGSSDNNVEAYLIDVTNPVANFKTKSGTIKVWGYAKGTTSGYTTPQYGFEGDKYISISNWGSGTTNNLSLSADENGNISGLPSMTSGVIIATRGI